MIEYLIRKKLDPTRLDVEGRSALHIAVKSGKVEAVRFMVKCGCDPYQADKEKTSPIDIAIDMQNRELLAVLKKEMSVNKLRERRKICGISFNGNRGDRRLPSPISPLSSSNAVVEVADVLEREELHDIENGDRQSLRLGTLLGSVSPPPTSQNEGQEGGSIVSYKVMSDTEVSLYRETINGDRSPHALCRLKPSRLSYAMIYALTVVGLWILSVCIPFYAWLVLITLLFLLIRYVSFIIIFFILLHF